MSSTLSAVTWSGGGGDATWAGNSGKNLDRNDNWAAPGKSPVNGDDLVFAGTTQLTNNNNITNLSVSSVTFLSGAGSFFLGGNQLNLTGSVTNSSSLLQTINMDLGLNATITFATNSADIAVTGKMTGSGGILKNGANNLILSGINDYTGATTVNGGKLLVNGSTSSSSAVTVNSGGTLGGSGTVGGTTIINGGNLEAGNNNVGLLTFGNNLTLQGLAQTLMQINGATRGTQHDGINVGGNLAYGGDLILNIGVTFNSSETFNLLDSSTHSGSFSKVTLTGQYSGELVNNSGQWSLTSGNNTWIFDQGTGSLSLTVIPEPDAALIGGLGILMLLLRRRRGNNRR